MAFVRLKNTFNSQKAILNIKKKKKKYSFGKKKKALLKVEKA
jgi:hypothetical protein